MQGITYLEWEKLKQTIDLCFSTEISAETNKIQLTGVDRIAEYYGRTF